LWQPKGRAGCLRHLCGFLQVCAREEMRCCAIAHSEMNQKGAATQSASLRLRHRRQKRTSDSPVRPALESCGEKSALDPALTSVFENAPFLADPGQMIYPAHGLGPVQDRDESRRSDQPQAPAVTGGVGSAVFTHAGPSSMSKRQWRAPAPESAVERWRAGSVMRTAAT
jgi:hypothetical protein